MHPVPPPAPPADTPLLHLPCSQCVLQAESFKRLATPRNTKDKKHLQPVCVMVQHSPEHHIAHALSVNGLNSSTCRCTKDAYLCATEYTRFTVRTSRANTACCTGQPGGNVGMILVHQHTRVLLADTMVVTEGVTESVQALANRVYLFKCRSMVDLKGVPVNVLFVTWLR